MEIDESKENKQNEDDIDAIAGGIKNENEQLGDAPGSAPGGAPGGGPGDAGVQQAQWIRDIQQYIAANRIPQGVNIKGQRVRGSVCFVYIISLIMCIITYVLLLYV